MISKEEIRVLELLKQDPAYKNYFFNKVVDTKWFYPLMEEGYFKVDQIPPPIKTDNGFQIPIWPPLLYFEKISKSIAAGNNNEFIEPLLNIIESVSREQQEKLNINNYRVWYFFIIILDNLPSNSLPKKIFSYIPVWLESEIQNSIVSCYIIKKLIPKFLSIQPSTKDRNKAEIILKHLLTVRKINSGDTDKWSIRADSHCLINSLKDEDLGEKIGQFCTNRMILKIADSLKSSLREYQRKIREHFHINNIEFQLTLTHNETDTMVVELLILQNDNSTFTFEIGHCESYSIDELVMKIEKSLIGNKIDVNKSLDFSENILHALKYGIYNDLSSIWVPSLREMDDDIRNGGETKEILTLILRDSLSSLAQYHPQRAGKIFETLMGNGYRMPIFTRLILYSVTENYKIQKHIFWEKLRNNDLEFFYNHAFQKEVYELLNINSKYFTDKEKRIIDRIIQKGPSTKRSAKTLDKEYWQLNWLSALREDEKFVERYNSLSEKLKITNEHFEQLGKVRFRIGSESPFSVEEILQKSHLEIVEHIRAFRPKNSFDEPSIEGFAKSLKEAVVKDPKYFSQSIREYEDLYYIYVYHLIGGFETACREKKTFDWDRVLNFCLSYISSAEFVQDSLKIDKGSLGVDSRRIEEEIALLISSGTQNDEWAFQKQLLPLAKKILIKLSTTIKPDSRSVQPSMDYPTHSLNSHNGKIIHGLFNYALRVGRLQPANRNRKWSSELQTLFEEILSNEIIEIYTIIGWHYRQFFFLDKNWVTSKIKDFIDLPGRSWNAFMGGFLFNGIVNNKDIYDLMFEHYERAINNELDFNYMGDVSTGLSRHIAGFYFLGYESINKDGLVSLFIKKSQPKRISHFVHFMWMQKDYIKELKDEAELEEFRHRMFQIWSTLNSKFEKTTEEDGLKVLSNLSKFTAFFDVLDDEIVKLIISSAKVVEKEYNVSILLEDLDRLKGTGDSIKNSRYIGEILRSIFENYTPYYERHNIVSLIKYLYYNKQDPIVRQHANYVCNEYSRRGYDFLRELYDRNN